MSEKYMAYMVIRTNSHSNYQKTLLLRHADHLEIPQCRFITSDLVPNRRLDQVRRIASDLINHEFQDLNFKSIERIGRVNGRHVYLVEFIGWPLPIDGHFSYFFADDFQLGSLTNGFRTVWEKVKAHDESMQSKNTPIVLDHT